MNKSDCQVAAGGQDLWSRTRVQARAVFPKGDITHIVQAIFNRPVPPVQLEEPTGRGQGGRQIRDKVDDLLGGFAGAPLRDGARELGDLLHERPVRTQVVIQVGCDQDAAFPSRGLVFAR